MLRIDNKKNSNQLHRGWLRQLLLEFDDICSSYGVYLTPPVFEISDSRERLGEWQAAARSIKISRYLIEENSWSVVIHVLKHEMAHQYCSEVLQSRDRPHGENFRLACERLGVPYEYRKARSGLHAAVQSDGFSSLTVIRGRKFLRRLEKLLALSHSGNEHEAALAMQKARELAEKYHCEPLLVGGRPDFTYLVIDRKRKRLSGYQKYICMILGEFYMVRVILSDRYDPLADDTFKTIELLGTRENLAIAEYCFHFLENQLRILWQANKQRYNGRSRRSMQNSYYLGVLKGFSEHLRGSAAGDTAAVPGLADSALIEVREGMLSSYVAMRFPRLQRSSATRIRVKTGAYERGVESGRALRFTHGIEQKGTEFGGYIETSVLK
jgi:hypothetical protein